MPNELNRCEAVRYPRSHARRAGHSYLKPALAAILVFVGTKMVMIDIYKIDPLISLAVIVTILVIAIVGSFIKQKAELRTRQPIADGGGVDG